MRYALRSIGVACVLALVLLAASRPAVPDASAAIYDFSAVDAIAANTVTSLGLPGGTLTITHEDEVLFEKSYGTYTPNTVIPIASASKWLSGATIMTLVDDGLVDLDAPISTYLPAWTGVKGTITLQQLFSHTSGLTVDSPCQGNYSITLAECTDQIYAAPMTSTPGTQFRYGGASMQVGGRIAEVVTGQSWADLFEERLAGPVGMDATFYWGAPNPQIGGSALSSSADYTRFLRMLAGDGVIDGATVLSPAAIDEMHLDQTAGAEIVQSPRGPNMRYGIGNWRDIVDGQGNAVQNSSPGAFSFNPWLDFPRDYGAVFGVYTTGYGVGGPVNQMQAATRAALVDADGDEVGDSIDTCLGLANPDNLNSDRSFIDTSPPRPDGQEDKTLANSDAAGDACDTDDDNDALPDAAETSGAPCASALAATDPLASDTDGDRVLDGPECALGSDPNSAASRPPTPLAAEDPDSDRLATPYETSIGSDPNDADSDDDGLADGVEVKGYNTNPLVVNTDGDTCGDRREVASVDPNTVVNSQDIGIVASLFGNPGGHANMDLDKNGAINSADLGQAAAAFGACP